MAVGFGLGAVVEVGIVFEFEVESGFGSELGFVAAGLEAEEVDLLNAKTLH